MDFENARFADLEEDDDHLNAWPGISIFSGLIAVVACLIGWYGMDIVWLAGTLL